MKKRTLIILMTFILGSAATLSPVQYAAAQEASSTEQGEMAPADDGPVPEEEPGRKEESSSEAGSAPEKKDKNLLDKGAEIGSGLYEKMDNAIDNMDKESLRKQIREALEEMDERGISPSSIAETFFGIRSGRASEGKSPGGVLIEDAQRTVRKKTEGFFTVLWNGFLDTLGNMISAGFSIMSGLSGNGAKGGSL